MKPFGPRVLSRGTQGHIERQEVLFCRVVLGCEWRLTPVVDKIVSLIIRQRNIEPVGEIVDPIRGRIVRTVAAKFRKIMREAAAADDQYAFISQRRQRTPDAKMVLWTQMRLHRELKHRNVGLRVHQQ